MTDSEWDQQIDLLRRSKEKAMLACAYLTAGSMTEAHRAAMAALNLEREALQIGTPRWRDFDEHVTSALKVVAP